MDGNAKRFDREGLHDEDLRIRNILHYHPFKLLRDCSTSAPPLSYAIAMSLYQIIDGDMVRYTCLVRL